ncbi:MAG: HPr(Ser) kinase/phosphatase [Candidatus Thiodiazotropha sp.]|nr:HPr(Ser) kinase/phosphatase [Candidatus Thiodiazotropha sp.]MCU7803335.1 HPr(Ser) kinase/phosphatase [Candidatus Thiodiazotropha sp. (ex Lucinoma borealis)]MCU7885483.1 HPr(Ser) kinase/phosphatase [Candidatus Thiodiazotropha sp. (ex Lucinoma annulata)]MCM8882629.1 HPr(Ser) kinase/phosphatase [Candidatus Thiodiazotropha sp.]MCM8919210.1 HPr(Ser) kinase/phosphatase [Candidatus Thiodiazotropha sp.]
MKPTYTIRDLYEELATELSLNWNGEGGDAGIILDVELQGGMQPAGPLNLIRPNQIQVIGPPERDHLLNEEDDVYHDYLQVLFSASPAALIFTDGLKPLQDCQEQAREKNVALFYTPQPDNQVIHRLLERFSQPMGEKLLVHGVYMEVLGKGVLLSGDPAIGKSELALALISRGHCLIADDATELYKTGSNTLSGRCPKVLQDFLEVRGLGLINIRAMFGNSAIKPNKQLHLIIDLLHFDDKKLHNMDRLEGCHSTRTLLGVETPQTSLPVAAGRNLAILVETAVRQHMLMLDGYNATQDFTDRQQIYIDQEQ